MINKEIVKKIKHLRHKKGYNHEDMAEKLNITRSAYQRLESGDTYSWAKYLDEIMKTFETTPKEFFHDIGRTKTVNLTNYDSSTGYYVETLLQENKETTEKLIEQYEDRIKEIKDFYEQKIKDIEEQLEFWKSKSE
ncbi:MAG: helix-turn-helix domain-containing protein [Flavobacteriaceae bacterium]|jgi:transcriptional regulator with XRE-family HTH domain|nr:helix-turn-helix domain-containing protein [Flavobacteriaceae bacterium]